MKGEWRLRQNCCFTSILTHAYFQKNFYPSSLKLFHIFPFNLSLDGGLVEYNRLIKKLNEEGYEVPI